jgi:hypothetical protein
MAARRPCKQRVFLTGLTGLTGFLLALELYPPNRRTSSGTHSVVGVKSLELLCTSGASLQVREAVLRAETQLLHRLKTKS